MSAIDQPLYGLFYLIGRKIPRQRAKNLVKALPTLRYRGRQPTENFAMKEELSVLGVEADGVWRHHKN